MSPLSQTRRSSSSPPLKGSSDKTHVSVSDQIYLHLSFRWRRAPLCFVVVVVSFLLVIPKEEGGRKKKEVKLHEDSCDWVEGGF